MAKRLANLSSDEESSPETTPPSKRAKRGRTERDAAPSATQRRDKKGKGPAREEDEDEEDDANMMEPVGEAVEPAEEEFERLHWDRVQTSVDEKRKTSGTIADHGIIEWIDMVQFMCHKYLIFKFGPQVNFIIGHNGSGKSAVLSAITVALGGKATSTGRGNGLKSFIREGEHAAEVTISLKNQGEEAYKPQEYGKSIVITRRFTKDGSSSWKIKSKDGRVVSTKKEELAAICDHMNIQVDNPMNILTQDSARQFLSASHPSDKYKFFLKGTQLSQLSEEYDVCLENIAQTGKILIQKKEAIPELHQALHEATTRFQEAEKARVQKHKADELKKELAWAHVHKKEQEMTAKMEEVAKLRHRLPRIQEKLDEAIAEHKDVGQRLTEIEEDNANLGTIEHLSERNDQIRLVMRANRDKILKFKEDIKRIQDGTARCNRMISEFQKSIEEEQSRMAAHTQAKRDESMRRIAEAKEAKTSAQQNLENLKQRKEALMKIVDEMGVQGVAMGKELEAIRARIIESQSMIQKCTENEKNSLVPYGRDMKTVLDKISGSRWFGDKPLGPLGLYVKAKDPKKWGGVLRNQLRGYLTSFALTDARDRNQLKQILDQTRNQVQIIIFQKDLFDYSSGEPPVNYLTVLRALEISDPYVLRILINQVNIERQILADTRFDAEASLRQLHGGGNAWSADGFNVRVFPEGGTSSSPFNWQQVGDATSLLLTGRDAKAELQHWSNLVAEAQDDYSKVKAKIDQARAEFQQQKTMLTDITGKERIAAQALRKAEQHLKTLEEEAYEDLPAGIGGLAQAKKDAEDEKETLHEQFEAVLEQKALVDGEQQDLIEQSKAIRRDIDAFDNKRNEIRKRMEEGAAVRMKAQQDINHFQAKMNEEQERINQTDEVVAVLQEEFTNWTAKAEEYCERVPHPRAPEEVNMMLKSVQDALKKQEKRHGATVEEMVVEVNKAKKDLDSAKSDLKQMISLNKALRSSLTKRLSRWQEFRRHIALRCKYEFQYHMSRRGYFGKVLFDHKNGTLQLKVQTDDQVNVQVGSREKDPRSLSGGEKSFSTICLLLSLWEAIGCPLRCLDEFDVFMDAVNRRISMRMMIETAKSSDKKQYILITPQDMTNITVGQEVRVHRMTDPERGQGVLNFGS